MMRCLRLATGCGVFLLGVVCAQARLHLPSYSFTTDTLSRELPGISAQECLPRVGGVPWGTALSQELRRRAETSMKEFVDANKDPELLDPDMPVFLEGEWRVEWATPVMVALRHNRLEFTGGAHPNHQCELVAMIWKGGSLLPVTVDKLLSWSPDLEKSLRRQTTGHLRLLGSEDAKAKNWKGLPAKRLKQALPTEAGLLYVLDPYEVGSFADGAYEFVVPWRALGDQVGFGEILSRELGR